MPDKKKSATKSIEDRVQDLEAKLKAAVLLGSLFGFSALGLLGWLGTEAEKVSKLQDQVNKMAPVVAQSEADIKRTGDEQIQAIRTQAAPIVRDLADRDLAESNKKIWDEINLLQADAYFPLYAQVVYGGPGGKFGSMMDNRKNWFLTYRRSKEDIQGLLASQGFPAQ